MKTAKELRAKMPYNLHHDRLGAAWWARGWNARRDGADRYEGMPFKDRGGHAARLRAHWLDGWDIANAEMIIEKGQQQFREVDVGTILEHSIGCGMDVYYQVVERKGNLVTARPIKSRHFDWDQKSQTDKVEPLKDQFDDGEKPVRLRLKIGHRGALQIGPIKRMVWWSVWDKKPKDQWSASTSARRPLITSTGPWWEW